MSLLTTAMYDNATMKDLNMSLSNLTYLTDYSSEKKTSLILGVLLTVAGVYIFLNMMWYEYRVKIKNKKALAVNRSRTKLIVDRPADWMRRLCLTASLLTLSRFVLEFLEIQKGQNSDYICNAVRQAKAILQCAAFTFIYLVLWLRQRRFYRLPAMEYLSNKPIRFFSAFVIVLMVIANILTIVLYLFTRTFKSSPRGCVLESSTVWTKLPGLLLFLFTCSFQLILLGLLIYPLYKHRTSSALVGQRSEIQVMKRVTIAAVIAATTTGLISLLAITALDNRYGALRQVVYDFDILISLISVTFSFVDWKARLCACAVKEEKIVGTVKRRLIASDRQGNLTTICDDPTT